MAKTRAKKGTAAAARSKPAKASIKKVASTAKKSTAPLKDATNAKPTKTISFYEIVTPIQSTNNNKKATSYKKFDLQKFCNEDIRNGHKNLTSDDRKLLNASSHSYGHSMRKDSAIPAFLKALEDSGQFDQMLELEIGPDAQLHPRILNQCGGTITPAKKYLANKALKKHMATLVKKRVKQGECPYYQPNTHAMMLRTLKSELSEKHDWQFSLDRDFKFRGGLWGAMKKLFEERGREYGNEYGTGSKKKILDEQDEQKIMDLSVFDENDLEQHQIKLMFANVAYQLVPPHDHRTNPAEKGIDTFKSHFIAGLSSLDPTFPLHLWCRLLPQAILTLNLLRPSRINPHLSAYALLNGTHDFNATPLAPPGTKVLVHETRDQRRTWAPKGTDGWYLGPAPEHYRCYRVYIPATRAERTAKTVEFFPHDCAVPVSTPADELSRKFGESAMSRNALAGAGATVGGVWTTLGGAGGIIVAVGGIVAGRTVACGGNLGDGTLGDGARCSFGGCGGCDNGLERSRADLKMSLSVSMARSWASPTVGKGALGGNFSVHQFDEVQPGQLGTRAR